MPVTTYEIDVRNYPNEASYPSSGSTAWLYLSDDTQDLHYWDATNNIYALYVGPRPRPKA